MRAARRPLSATLVVTAANVASHGMPTLPDVEILRKPFDLDRLLAIIERYGGAARVRREASPVERLGVCRRLTAK